MQFIEKGIENLSLTPNSARILQTKWLQQEKRLVTLAISKRKSSAEIKQKIAHQKEIAKRQVCNQMIQSPILYRLYSFYLFID